MLHSIYQQIWKTQQWPQDWKKSVFITIPKKGKAKEYSSYRIIELNSHASKVNSKFSKPGFKSTWNMNFQIVKLDLEKAKEPEIKLPTSAGSSKGKRVPEKHLLMPYWLCQSLWLCGSQQTVENSSEMVIPDHLTCLLRNLYQVKKQHLELDMEQWTCFKLGKEYVKAVYCHHAYLT